MVASLPPPPKWIASRFAVTHSKRFTGRAVSRQKSDIDKCLFGRWEYAYKGNSLRLSPDEAQRYAYRASDPGEEGAHTEKGASGLGGLGLLSFPISEGQKYWAMPAYRGRRSDGELSWPIWSANGGRGSSLCTIEAMLQSLPVIGHESTTFFGHLAMIATARRYVLGTEGYYGNIGRAEIEPLSEWQEALRHE
jgi:hypothetical protein